jgi:uncharacterized SAM-binding protein YcdF (DUF218 family)
MFLFKKVVSQFFFPMPLCLSVCFLGLALLWWTQKQKAGKGLVTAGLLALTALSYAPVADALLLPLERQYPVYARKDSVPVKYVVVLGGGHNSDPTFPLSSRLSDESLKRLVEGIRVYRENAGSKLILSGGSWRDAVSDAKVMADTAELLGINPADIVLEPDSKDTEEEARLIKPMVSTNSFVLVTSANHMPRSMVFFERQGLRAVPAPTDYLFIRPLNGLGVFLPSAYWLRRSERSFYEYMGTAWTAVNARL